MVLCQHLSLLPFLSHGVGARWSGCPKLQEETMVEFKMNMLRVEKKKLGGEYVYGSREEYRQHEKYG